MKILFISQYFYPEIFKGNDIAFDLAKRGNKVTVITGIPNYPKGEFYKGYSLFKKRSEYLKGVHIIRVPIIPRGKGNAILLLFNYFSYAIIGSIYTLFLSLLKKYDRIFVQQLSPVTMSFPAIIYKKLRGTYLLTWVLDLWPDSLSAAGGIKNKYILNFFDIFAKLEYANSDKILISSNKFREAILKKGDWNNKIIYFPNWAEDIFINYKYQDKDNIILPKGFKILFAGNIGEAQDFDSIMKAAYLLKNNKFIKFIIIGDGRKKEWVDNFVNLHHMRDTIILLGRLPIEVMPKYYAQADVMLVSLKPDYLFTITAPAKIQAYMLSKKPIIGMMSGEGSDIIKQANCGFCVNAGKYEELKDIILKTSLLSKNNLKILGDNGYNFYKSNFDKQKCMDNLYRIIN
jgi:Glycosyltransferase